LLDDLFWSKIAKTALLIKHKDSRYVLHSEELKRMEKAGSCHKHQKPQAPTPQAPIRNRQTRKVANAKGLNRNTNLT